MKLCALLRRTSCLHLGLVLAILGTTASLFGQQNDQYHFTLDLGYRWRVNFKGSEDLYRSQINLGEGPKLFNGDFFYAPAADSNAWMDRFELKMNSWGGEPYNTLSLRMGKADLYDFSFNYLNAQYFNSIPSFANPFFQQGSLVSQHRFDISQRVWDFEFRLKPNSRVSPFIAFSRATRQGPVATTFTVSAADEFQVKSDLEDRTNQLRGGVNLRLGRFNLVLEQGVNWYRDLTEYQTEGPSSGNSLRQFLGRDIEVTDFHSRNDFDASTPFSSASATFTPFRSLSLRGKVTYSLLDLTSLYNEESTGTFFAFPPVSAFYEGSRVADTGSAKSPALTGDFSAQWQPHRRIRVIERFAFRRFHVSSALLSDQVLLNVDPLLEAGTRDQQEIQTPFASFLATNVALQDLQGWFYVTPSVALRVGHRFERKEVILDRSLSRDLNVLVLGATANLPKGSRFSVDYELGRSDQPIFRTDYVDFHKVRLRGRFVVNDRLQFNGSVALLDNEDDLSEINFNSENRDYFVGFDFQPADLVSVSGEWGRSRIDTELLIVRPQTFTTFPSLYKERGDYGNVGLDFHLPHNAQLQLTYSVWGNVGNFPLNYHRPRAHFEIPVAERVSVYGEWEYIDYNEKVQLFPQDYRTHLIVMGFKIAMDKQ